MSATTQPKTFLDLYVSLQNAVRDQVSVTATQEIAKRLIQTAHYDLYAGNGEKLRWCERRGFITTHAEYTTGTLTGTQGNAAITGSGTLWNTTNGQGQPNLRAGGKLVISGTEEVYDVLAVASDTAATISPSFIGETAAGLSYRYFEDEYALASDFLKPIDARSFDEESEIRLIGRTDFRRYFPRNRVTSTRVQCGTIVEHAPSGSTTPIRKIRFGPGPSNVQIIPYSYVTRNIVVSSAGVAGTEFSADTDEPTMPVEYRHLIVRGALVDFYEHRKGDTERANNARGDYSTLLLRMLEDQDIGGQKLEIKTARQAYRVRARSPWRGHGGRWDVNGRFDRFQD